MSGESARRSWRIEVTPPAGDPAEVFLEAEAGSSTDDLLRELDRLGFDSSKAHVGDAAVVAGATIGSLGLRHGSTITIGGPSGDAARDEPNTGHWFVALYGPDAGACFRLGESEKIVGRNHAAAISLADPLLSNQHLSVRVRNGVVEVEDLGSTNGTTIEGEPILPSDGWVGLEVDAYLRVGSSVCTVLEIGDEEVAVLGDDQAPDRSIQRRFRQAEERLPARLNPPTERDDDSTMSTTWWRSLTPVVSGVGFAVITGRWQYLLISVLAPVVFTFDALRRNRKTKERRAQLAKRYALELQVFEDNLAVTRHRETERSRRLGVGGGVGTMHCLLSHQRLWERSPSDDDFASVTVGLAALPSTVQVGTEDDFNRHHLVDVPLTTPLLTTGSLGVLGPQSRTTAVLRSMLVGLAASHSPSDLHVWLFSDGVRSSGWKFARWLPHAYVSDTTATIATTASDRNELWQSVRQELATRRAAVEAAHEAIALPIHLIVLDDSALVGEADLTDLLRNGPAYGIIAIVADSRRLPEGVAAQLTIGEYADDATFESRERPHVAAVRTAEMSTAVAERAAHALSDLRPATSAGSSAMESVVNLVDLLGIESIDSDQLVNRWRQLSPHTGAMVGVATDAPLRIDIADDGPHGLVGGMSGSGKTEFLMTFLTSLCLDNHPDDLAIVIVDFKGGVDHALTSTLPHVVGLSTNLQIDQFTRTITLLEAEQRRRQDLLAGVGGDLDAYRSARTSRPELPPLPRLLVIVDEFSELLASDEGRAHLGELVRVTRIGRALGVHLLLVTQNFEGQLPPQVEANAGLRVCLRVMKEGHSKVVLDSGVAATISDRDIGRAYARLSGGDLVEFQTARVAGRRSDLNEGTPPVSLALAPWQSRCRQQAKRREAKPPVEQTDMYRLIEVMTEAAAATGWQSSAVPWPSELPDSLSLRSILDSKRPNGGVQIGMQDVPERQTQLPFSIPDSSEQLLMIGAANSAATEAALAFATSAALTESPTSLHIHGIDLEAGGLARLSSFPHVGTIATRNEALALKVVKHLLGVAASRRALLMSSGATTVAEHERQTGTLLPTQLLIVLGADRLARRVDDELAQLASSLQSLMAESVGTGIRIILVGQPVIAETRLGSAVDHRLLFRMPGETRASTYGSPRELEVELEHHGRCVDSLSKRLVQIAHPTGSDDVAGSLQKLGERLTSATASLEGERAKRQIDVTWPYPMASIRAADLRLPHDVPIAVPVSVDLIDGAIEWFDAGEDGPVLAITGGPKSGRSSALAGIAHMSRQSGFTTVGVATSRRSPLLDQLAPHFDLVVEAVSTDEILRAVAKAAPSTRCVVLIDDANRLDSGAVDLSAVASNNAVAALVLSGPIDFFDGRTDLRRQLPSKLNGLLLAPSGFADGAAVGLVGRLAEEHRLNPKAGRGLLVVRGEAKPVQMPLVPTSSGR